MPYTRVYIWIKYKRKQSLVKHNTRKNFSLATDVTAGTAVSPRRRTCMAYADIDTVYLVFPSLPPRALFFVVTAEVIPSGRNPLPGIFRLSKHEIAHQTRGIEVSHRFPPPLRKYIQIRLSLVPGILSRILPFLIAIYTDGYISDYPRYLGYSRYPAYSRYRVYSRYHQNSRQRDS